MKTIFSPRLTVAAWAEKKGLHPETVRNMCREGSRIVARRVGRSWEIDEERTEKLQSLKFGNAAERELAAKG